MSEFKTNEQQLIERMAAAGVSGDKAYLVVRGGFAGDVVTLDMRASYVGSDGTAWVVVVNADGKQMSRASLEEFKSLTEEAR